ncbi:MAG TPA: NADP-dependent oxidoreductase [Ilumatobacter sp.]|nr:NADP-dependent oxidoreductase [Ilumatobacter sp.]
MVVLRGRPGLGADPTPDLFAIEERPIPEMQTGQLLVRNIAMSVDPSMRGRLDLGEKHYTTNFEVGQPLDGSAIGQVIATEGGIPVGAVVRHRAGWREHAVVDAETVAVVDPDAAPVGAWLGILGQTGFTAWVGLKRIGELHAGDTVFVSAAAGAVGSAAGRFAKLLGAGRVVGSAGGPDKVRELVEHLAFDDAMDYRAESPRQAVSRLAPDGIDVYFDNVGGPHLVAALKNMTVGGRVALCGMISQYADNGRGEDINNLIEAVLRRVTIRGFIVRDHEDMRPEFEHTVTAWLASGDVQVLQTVTDGIDHAVEGFLGMLKGANVGKALVRLDPTWEI